jgi:hypothetical protein
MGEIEIFGLGIAKAKIAIFNRKGQPARTSKKKLAATTNLV